MNLHWWCSTLLGDNGPMAEAGGAVAIPIRGGRIEVFRLPVTASAHGTPLLVLGGVETGLRQLAGTEQVLMRRWEGRAAARPVVVVGRPLADDPSQVEHLMHPRIIADAVVTAIDWLDANGGPEPPFAIEAESGGGRISLWLTAGHPELVARLVLASVASETPAASPMAERMNRWIQMAEADDWGRFFGNMATCHEAGLRRRRRRRSRRRPVSSRGRPPRSASSGSCEPRSTRAPS